MPFVATVFLITFCIGLLKKFFCDVSGTKKIYIKENHYNISCEIVQILTSSFFFLVVFMAVQLNSHQITRNSPVFPNALSWCLQLTICLKYDIILMEHIQFVASQFQQEQLNLSPFRQIVNEKVAEQSFSCNMQFFLLKYRSLTEPFSAQYFLLCATELSLTLGS